MERDDQGVDGAGWGQVADPSRSLYVLKKSVLSIQIMSGQVSSEDEIGVSKVTLQWALLLLLPED